MGDGGRSGCSVPIAISICSYRLVALLGVR